MEKGTVRCSEFVSKMSSRCLLYSATPTRCSYSLSRRNMNQHRLLFFCARSVCCARSCPLVRLSHLTLHVPHRPFPSACYFCCFVALTQRYETGMATYEASLHAQLSAANENRSRGCITTLTNVSSMNCSAITFYTYGWVYT